MKPLTFDRNCYRSGGKPIYLNSGEMHYFRVPKKDWRTRMRLLKDAGGNALATYVPWLIHEPVEGQFAFDRGDGVTDLEAFLDLAAGEGLMVMVRPGPYQYSEMIYDGLPGWLCREYPQIQARGPDGKPYRHSSVSYLHPLFIEKTKAWYAQVCPRLARHTVSHGGAVCLVQPDNELGGVQIWHGSMDCHPETMGFGREDGRFPQFLKQRYGVIAELNRRYGSSFGAFTEITPAKAPAGGQARQRWDRDYFEFYAGTLAEYVRLLTNLMREHGIDTPFAHNSAGPSMNVYFVETVRAMGCGFLLGTDHYYTLNQDWAQNNPTPQYAATCFASLESLRMFGYPPTVFELQGGSAADFPPVTGQDTRACYFMHAAFGMKGHNYYIFTGGPNPPGVGATSDLYDYGAAIGPAGEVRPVYHAQKTYGRFMKRNSWLVEAEQACDFRIGFEWDTQRGRSYSGFTPPGCESGASIWRFLQRGLLTTAFCGHLSPQFVDLDGEECLGDTRTPVYLPTTGWMPAARQLRLAKFVKAGGRLVIGPVLPRLDENWDPCTAFADALGIAADLELIDSKNGITRPIIAGVTNVANTGALYSQTAPAGAEVIGVDEISGKTVAWRLRVPGGGEVIFLGLNWFHTMHEHWRMLQKVLTLAGLQPWLEADNPNVWMTLRHTPDKAMLFVMNLLSAPAEVTVRWRLAAGKAWSSTGRLNLPPMTVKTLSIKGGRDR